MLEGEAELGVLTRHLKEFLSLVLWAYLSLQVSRDWGVVELMEVDLGHCSLASLILRLLLMNGIEQLPLWESPVAVSVLTTALLISNSFTKGTYQLLLVSSSSFCTVTKETKIKLKIRGSRKL